MRVDEILEHQRAIKAFEPCPSCGAVKPSTDEVIMHLPDCPFPIELAKLEAGDIQ